MQPRKLVFGLQPYVDPTRRNMEDNLNIFQDGRRPQFYLFYWNTTSIFVIQLQDDLIFYLKVYLGLILFKKKFEVVFNQ